MFVTELPCTMICIFALSQILTPNFIMRVLLGFFDTGTIMKKLFIKVLHVTNQVIS